MSKRDVKLNFARIVRQKKFSMKWNFSVVVCHGKYTVLLEERYLNKKRMSLYSFIHIKQF